MRLWHKDLISVLPRQQLLSQWRECCLIAKNIEEKGTPNHLLVNKIMDYPLHHFAIYAYRVYEEMRKRGYAVNWDKFAKYITQYPLTVSVHSDLFEGWHDGIYLRQCYFNLEEKYCCGGIPKDEWEKIRTSLKEEIERW